MFQNKNSAAVKKNKLFTGIADPEIKLKFNPQNFLELKEGEIIYQKGEESNFIYLILEGEIKIKFIWTQEQRGLVRKSDNDFFGDDELLAKCSRRSSAVALTDCLLYTIDRNELEYIASLNKPLLMNLGLPDVSTDLYNLTGDAKIEHRTTTEKIGVFEEYEKPPAAEEVIIPAVSVPEVSANLDFNDENKDYFEVNVHPGIDKVEFFKQELLEDPEDDTDIKFSDTFEENDAPPQTEIPGNENDVAIPLEYPAPSSIDFKPEIANSAEETKAILTSDESEIIFDDEVYLKIYSGINLEETLNSIIQTCKFLTDADKGTIYFSNDNGSSFYGKVSPGGDTNEIEFSNGEGLPGLASANKAAIRINDTDSERGANDKFDISPDYKTLNTMCFPIIDESENVLSVIQLFNSKKGEFSLIDEKKLTILSKHFLSALKKAIGVNALIHSGRMTSMMEILNFLISDIKIPILTIKHYAALLKKQDIPAEAKNILDLFTSQASSIVDLVQTTFEFTQDKKSVNPVVSNLGAVLDEVLVLLSEYVESRNVKLFKKIEGVAKVEIDKRAFYQACFQIAKNACDVMPGGGSIFVTCSNDNDYIRVDIKDEGPGIPPGINETLFDPFVSQGKPGGTGIGLSIAKKIIAELNGNISVRSNLSEGTTFTILLPVVKN